MIFRDRVPWPRKLAVRLLCPRVHSGHYEGYWPPGRAPARQGDEQGRAHSSGHRQLLERLPPPGENPGWELHVAQPKFLSWQQLFVETEGVLKRAPFYGPCDNNRECCNVITRVSELQRSDVSLTFGPFSPAGEGKDYSEEKAPSLLVVKWWRGKNHSENTPQNQTKKWKHKLCCVVKVAYNWHCSHICYFDYVVSVLQGCNSQGCVLVSGLQTQTPVCLVSLAGPINLAFLFCIVVWLQQKHGSGPSCRLTCGSYFWETGAADWNPFLARRLQKPPFVFCGWNNSTATWSQQVIPSAAK